VTATKPVQTLQRTLFRIFGALPTPLRRFIVRRVTPSWTAGAVAIIARDDGRLLLVKPVYRKAWTFPGGLLNRGERPAEAIHRELNEELGLTVTINEDPWIIYDTVLRRIDTVFLAAVVDGIDLETIMVQTPELDEVGWFPVDSPPPVEDETQDVIDLSQQVASGGSRILFR